MGRLNREGLTAHQRLQFTLHCQLCGEVYQRATDLSAHMQQTHGTLWAKAGELVRFMLQTLISRTGCLCNPCTNDRSRAHVCKLLYQVAMIFLISEMDILLPWQYSEAEVTLATQAWAPRSQYQRLINVLMDRDFSHLWHAPVLLQLYRNWCYCCGGWYHTAAMVAHQLRDHHMECQWAAQIKFQILQCMKAEMQTDYQCHFCRLIFNHVPSTDTEPNARDELVQIHLTSNCPVLQQICLLLLPIHGRPHHDGPVRCGAAPVVLSAGPFDAGGKQVPPFKRRRTTVKKGQAEASTAVSESGGPSAGHAHPDEADGTGGAAARSRPAAAAQAGMLRFVRPIGPGKCTVGADATDAGVESQDGAGAGAPQVAEPAHILTSEFDPGVATTSGEALSEQCRSAPVGQSSLRGSDTGRWQLAVSEMVPHLPEADQLTSAADPDGESSQGHAVAHGVVGGEWAGPEIPRGEATSIHGAVAPPDFIAGAGCLAIAHQVDSVDHLDIDRSVVESSLADPQQECSSPGDLPDRQAEQRPWEGEAETGQMTAEARAALRTALLSLAYDNTGTQCYANASLCSFVWACLSRKTFTIGEWGESAAALCSMIQHTDGLFRIEDQPWFQALMTTWGIMPGQADSAEFTGQLIRWVKPAACNCFWQRRWMQCENVLIHDHGDAFMPVFLQIHPVHISHGIIRLTDMVRTWHNELGMYAGILRPRDLLCVHIDRLTETVNGPQKLDTPVIFTGPIDIPVFDDGCISCTWHQFYTVAVFAHFGADNAGHYQALLRVKPPGNPIHSHWMLCDDCRTPRVCHEIPPNFHAGVTCAWLCRAESMELHDVSLDHTQPDLMQMLTA